MKIKYLVLMIFLLGCNSSNKFTDINELNMQQLSRIPDSLSYIFPRVLDSDALIYSGLYEGVENHMYMLAVPHSDTLFNNIASNNFLAQYSSYDPNLIIVGRNVFKDDSIRVEFNENYIPIPNFAPINCSGDIVDLNKDRLPKEYTIYVLDASYGKFVKNSWLSEGMGLPEKWKNGYSMGYAMSSNRKDKIIYWLIMW